MKAVRIQVLSSAVLLLIFFSAVPMNAWAGGYVHPADSAGWVQKIADFLTGKKQPESPYITQAQTGGGGYIRPANSTGWIQKLVNLVTGGKEQSNNPYVKSTG